MMDSTWQKLRGRLKLEELWPRGFESHPSHVDYWDGSGVQGCGHVGSNPTRVTMQHQSVRALHQRDQARKGLLLETQPPLQPAEQAGCLIR